MTVTSLVAVVIACCLVIALLTLVVVCVMRAGDDPISKMVARATMLYLWDSPHSHDDGWPSAGLIYHGGGYSVLVRAVEEPIMVTITHDATAKSCEVPLQAFQWQALRMYLNLQEK